MNYSKSKTAKIFAGVVGFAIALAFVVTPVTTKAQSTSELQAQINALLATIAALQSQAGGTSMSGSYTFNNDLTIGSTGADVSALQTKLVEAGYLTMPSGTAMGYFGSLTAAAVKSWQASVGLPATGYFGPLSRAKLNATVSTPSTPGVYPAGCTSSAGYSSTTGMPCNSGSSYPAGCTSSVGYSTTTGMPCNSGTQTNMNGTDGSVTLSYVSYAPASQTLKKGDMNKPVVSVKLQAVNGPVNVTRFDVHFSERPWLVFGKLTLTDSTGAVLATKMLTGAADATEVTVGTDYLVRFDNVNVQVTPGTDKILAVNLDVLAATDKITGQTVYVGVPSGSIRTINGRGYTDSIGLSSGQGSGVVQGTGNAVTLSSSGSTAQIYTRIDPSSPATDRIVVTSANQTTPNVTLGVFGVKSENQSSTINGLTLNFGTNGVEADNVYSNLRIQVGGMTYGSNQIGTSTTFTNMSIPLAVDAWVPLTVIADVQAGVNATNASTTLDASTIVGVDSNFNSLTISGGDQTSSNNIYSITGINVTPGAATLSNCGASYTNGPTDSCSMKMVFTVTNVGNTNIYLSKNPAIALATSSSPTTSSTTLSSISIAAASGDTTTSYVVSSNGSRTFEYSGRFGRPINLAFESFNITGVRFGDDTTDGTTVAGLGNTSVQASSNAESIINFGLEPLRVTY